MQIPPFQVRGYPTFVDGLMDSLLAGDIAYNRQAILFTAVAVALLVCYALDGYKHPGRSVITILGAWAFVGFCLCPWVGFYYWPDLASRFPTYSGFPDFAWIYPSFTAIAAAILATFPEIVHSAVPADADQHDPELHDGAQDQDYAEFLMRLHHYDVLDAIAAGRTHTCDILDSVPWSPLTVHNALTDLCDRFGLITSPALGEWQIVGQPNLQLVPPPTLPTTR